MRAFFWGGEILLGHIQKYSRLTPGWVCRYHYWWCLEDHTKSRIKSGSKACNASILPPVLSLFSSKKPLFAFIYFLEGYFWQCLENQVVPVTKPRTLKNVPLWICPLMENSLKQIRASPEKFPVLLWLKTYKYVLMTFHIFHMFQKLWLLYEM